MLTVYLQGKMATTVPYKQLPTNAIDLQKYLLGIFDGKGYQTVEVYDISGQLAQGGQLDPSWLTYGVVSASPEEAAKWKPIKITLRRTDKTGHVLFKHPATTLGQLQQAIQQLTKVTPANQQLLHKGYHLTDAGATIEQIGLRQSSILHLIDLQEQPTNPDQTFLLNVQTAQSFSQTYQIEVASNFSVLRLKQYVGDLFEILPENLLITYCGMILGHDDAILQEYKLVPGAFINAINEKKTFKPRNDGQAVHVTIKETSRVVPTTEQHEISLGGTPVVTSSEPTVVIPPTITEVTVVPTVSTVPDTKENSVLTSKGENDKKAVTMSFSISSESQQEIGQQPPQPTDSDQ